MPRTMNPISPACRPVSESAATERKLGIARDSANATSTNTMTGIAVSIQRLARISPSAWSGQYL